MTAVEFNIILSTDEPDIVNWLYQIGFVSTPWDLLSESGGDLPGVIELTVHGNYDRPSPSEGYRGGFAWDSVEFEGKNVWPEHIPARIEQIIEQGWENYPEAANAY